MSISKIYGVGSLSSLLSLSLSLMHSMSFYAVHTHISSYVTAIEKPFLLPSLLLMKTTVEICMQNSTLFISAFR